MTEILTFIKRNIPSLKLPKEGLSSMSKILIRKIVNQMELAVNSWKLNQTYRERILSSEADDFKGPDFEYIVDEIKEDLSASNLAGKKYSFVIGSRTFTINVIYPHSYKPTFLDVAIKKMYVWLFVANHFADSGCSPNLTVYWYLTKHKKIIPRENEVIDRVHVNTAFTMACPARANTIYIFREEEWFKVLIHESFHSMGIDFAKLPEEAANAAIYAIFPVNCDLRFSEAYTESWAEIIHVVFLSVGEYSCKESAIDINKLSKAIERKMDNERMFSMFQLAKVLHHNKTTYRGLFTKNRYKEASHVFSYYVLKTIFIFFYNEFIEWTTENNDGTITFKKTQENILSLVGFIRDRCREPQFMQTINIFEKAVPTLQKGHAMETMQMSISE
jgi:hypothetical protein